ncbi:MAG: PspC domain-containing protein [Candidatus Nanohaloarchaea archaeon]
MGGRLYRSEDDYMLCGVCGGIAEVYDLDPSLVRLVTLLLVFSGVSPLLYLVACLIIPKESEIEAEES